MIGLRWQNHKYLPAKAFLAFFFACSCFPKAMSTEIAAPAGNEPSKISSLGLSARLKKMPLESVRYEPDALVVYEDFIASMETTDGAYAPGLPEQLLGLGLNLQMLNRHREAAKIFKRGVHVSRVQSGLYTGSQIPLLKAEIRSLAALEQYGLVDERQRYLARVESRSLTNRATSIHALMDQAAWAEEAWILEVGDMESRPNFLNRSWTYYQLAYNQAIEFYGPFSKELLEPLEGMLRLNYRFASLSQSTSSDRSNRDNFQHSSTLAAIYRQGESVLKTIYKLNLQNTGSATKQAEDLARLGDWAWWVGRRTDARRYYQRAWNRITLGDEVKPKFKSPIHEENIGVKNELGVEAPTDEVTQKVSLQQTFSVTNGENTKIQQADSEPQPVDDPVARAYLFEKATPLPDIDQLRHLPSFKRDESGPLVVEFKVSSAGKITQLKQKEFKQVKETGGNNENKAVDIVEQNQSAVDRLMRELKKTKFRPRLKNSGELETDLNTWSFNLDPKSNGAES